MSMANNEIYFGLDLGTENIGYAVTDENYKIKKAYGKRAIGVRFFEEAQTAAERRSFRAGRRRLERRKYRITLLQELFDSEMNKIDCNFFKKLNENDLHIEDRLDISRKYSLFNDKNFNDKQYYKKYPTIYHLRQELMEKPAQDIRLLYLAIHHIIKYRGNFLKAGDIKECRNPKEYFNLLNVAIQESQLDENNEQNNLMPFNLDNIDKLAEVIVNKKLRRKEKVEEVCNLLNVSKSQKKLVETIFGGIVNLVTIFGNGKYSADDLEKPKFYFSDDFDLIEPALRSDLDDYEYNIIVNLKNLYDWQVLTSMLAGKNYLSEAMVENYNKHSEDLRKLKYIIKNYAPSKYEYMFGEPLKKDSLAIDSKNDNYTKYIGGGFYNGQKLGKKYEDGKLVVNKENISRNGRLGVTCAVKEDFYKTVKSVIGDLVVNNEEDNKLLSEILQDIEDGIFMPKINCKNNSTIPYQLNMIELEKILAVQSQKYTFLQEVENGITIADKIKSLLKFRIPYYVGPVKYFDDNQERKNIWAVRNKGTEHMRVTPWSFDKIIDKSASNKQFIERMTTNCTYLRKEKTLPKKSLLFSAFVVLQEINKIKIDGNKYLPTDLKKGIFKDLYLQKGKPTKKQIIEYIKKETGLLDVNLSLAECDMQGSMKTYVDFKKRLGDKVDKYPDMIEKIIFYCTIFADDSNMIEEEIANAYGSKSENPILTEAEIKSIKGFRFDGWSSLSRALLMGSTANTHGIMLTDSMGNKHDIIEIIWNTNQNLMEIINSKEYDFDKALEEYNINNGIKENSNITYDDIDELYCSPSVKRCIYQAFLMTEELTKIFGRPTKIFIESTRTNQDTQKNKRTVSRKEKMLALYDEAQKTDKKLYQQLSGDLYAKLRYENNINAEKIYLYYLQMGRDMYSGNTINIDELASYDVDHIIPQSIIKDDSINNKVLVKKVLNEEKTNEYPIPNKFRQITLWKNLKSLKLLSEDKYNRLVRVEKVSEEEQQKFVNRQLVETNQTVKETKNILNRYFNSENCDNKVEIVLSKANNVSDFRKDYHLTKSREANNFHHGADAYLNIVVGDVLNEQFNHSRNYKDNQKEQFDNKGNRIEKSYNFRRAFYRCIYSDRQQRCIWYPVGHKLSTLNVVKKQLDSFDYQMSKKVVTGKGKLYDESIYKVGKGGIYPINEKLGDVTKYGGKKSGKITYFIVVDSLDKKGNAKRTIEAMPIYFDKQIKLGKLTVEEYLTNNLGLISPKLAKIDGLKDSKLLFGSLLEFNNNGIKSKLRLASSSTKQLFWHNANELYVTKEQNDYIKEISLVVDKVSKNYLKLKNEDSFAKLTDAELKVVAFNNLEEDKQRRLKEDNQKSKIIPIKMEDNIMLYDFFVEKLTNDNSPYKYIPTYNSLAQILVDGKESFIVMDKYMQIVVLLKLIVAFQCNKELVDASDIKYIDEKGKIKIGGVTQCKISTSKEISGKDIVFITQSVTGLREKRIKIS